MEKSKCISDAVIYRECDHICLSKKKREYCYRNLASDIEVCKAKYYETKVKSYNYNKSLKSTYSDINS
jgi:hypothetical protein